MAETADSVIVAIEARTGAFTPAVQQSATAFDNAMKQVETSATRMERQVGHSFDNTRISQQILMHVARSTADQFASGAPPMMIFTQHLAQLAEAGAYAGGSLGRFGTLLQGPWGMALTFAITILGTLIAKHGEGSEAAHRHETSEQTLIRALNGEADAVAKVTDALRAMREESARALETDNERIEKTHKLAQEQLAVALATRQRLAADLEAARAAAIASGAAASDPTLAGEGGFNPGAAQGALQGGRLSDITAQINENNRQIAIAQGVIANTTAEFARNVATHVGVVNEEFNRRRGVLENETAAQIRAAHTDDERNRITLRAQAAEHALNVERERSVRAAQLLDDAEQGVTHRHRTPGEDVVDRAALIATARQHLGQTEGANSATLQSFFRSAGININPAQMAWCAAFVAAVLASNGLPVARGPDGNAALGARAYLNYGSATTHPEAGDIVVLRDQNRRRNSPDHGHTGFFEGFDANGRVRVLGGNQGRGGGVSETTFARSDVLAYRRAPTAAEAQTSEERAARQAAELADHRARDEERFQQQLAGLNTELLNARRQTVQTEQDAAAADIAAINAQRDQRNERIRNEAADRTRRDASQAVEANIEAGFLLAKSEELARIQRDNSNAVHQQRIDEQRVSIAIADLNDAESIERARGALARTAGERQGSELRLLDYQHQEELLQIEKLRLQGSLNEKDRQRLDRQEQAANERYGLAQENIRRQYQGPLAQYFEQVPQGADAMNRALQSVAVDGLQQLNDGLAQAATRFLHLGGVAGHVLDAIISDLIQIVLRQAELAAFGGAQGGGFSGFLSSITSMFGGSGGKGGGAAAGADGFEWLFKSAGLAGFAAGGRPPPNQISIVGENGAELFVPDSAGTIIPQGKALSFGGNRAASPAPQITIISAPQFDLRGVVTTPQLMREIDRVSRAHAAQAAAAMGQGVMKAIPSRLVQYQSDGI